MSLRFTVIRRARSADGERVAEMIRALARHEGKTKTAMTAAAFRRLGCGRNRRFSTLVAEADGKLRGYAAYMPVFAIAELETGVFVDDLWVEPRWRKRGLGRMLMQAVASDCLNGGGAYVMWNVRFANTGAVAFYDGLGAVKTDYNYRWIEGEAFRRLASE
jgi:GNAT superfamily N-acetyltransferase